MVALITPPAGPVPARRPVADRAARDRPGLHVIRGGLDQPAVDRSSWYAAAAVALVILAVVVLRLVQGGPPSAESAFGVHEGVVVPAGADVAAGEAVLIAAPGDTMWALAEALAPGRDPRPVVDILADRNGGTALRVGQRIVVPQELVALANGRPSQGSLALAEPAISVDS